MATSAATSSSTARNRSQLRNITDLGALIERADDIVATIARNRAARAGLGKTGRSVLRDHERQLEAELGGIRELASHQKAGSASQIFFLVILAIVDLREARARASRHNDADLAAVLERIERLLDHTRYGFDPLAETAGIDWVGNRLAPLTEGPHMRAAKAMERIQQAETSNG